jgi:hypothetical protein
MQQFTCAEISRHAHTTHGKTSAATNNDLAVKHDDVATLWRSCERHNVVSATN